MLEWINNVIKLEDLNEVDIEIMGIFLSALNGANTQKDTANGSVILY